MNISESNLLSSKIISGNPSLKQVWVDVHRSSLFEYLLKAAPHFHLSNNSKLRMLNWSEGNHAY